MEALNIISSQNRPSTVLTIPTRLPLTSTVMNARCAFVIPSQRTWWCSSMLGGTRYNTSNFELNLEFTFKLNKKLFCLFSFKCFYRAPAGRMKRSYPPGRKPNGKVMNIRKLLTYIDLTSRFSVPVLSEFTKIEGKKKLELSSKVK